MDAITDSCCGIDVTAAAAININNNHRGFTNIIQIAA